MVRVLIVGGLAGALGSAARAARAAGAQVTHAEGETSALAAARADGGLALILCDLALDVPGLLGALAAERIAAPLVAASADPDPARAAAAIRAGARDVVAIPPDPAWLAAFLAETTAPAAPIARDPAMLAVLRRAEQVARSDASVLITGESGTGKEVMARHIHARSTRAGGPFVAVNCAAIPEALLESELFGHEKGAFSGALARRVGKFEAAHGGTLLLDEISEMDLRLQAKLLRAIQEREIDRVGGAAPVRVDVRLLATSNRDLPAECAAGRFREDLYFRLNVVSLALPPLRARRADIGPLALHYARLYADANGVAARRISPAAVALLEAHAWRGNVRELENCLHRAVLLATGEEIGPEAIELAPARAPPEPAPAQAGPLVARRMADVERELILNTLGHTAGNRTHAALLLGISLRALRNKLRDYAVAGVNVPPPPTGIAA